MSIFWKRIWAYLIDLAFFSMFFYLFFVVMNKIHFFELFSFVPKYFDVDLLVFLLFFILLSVYFAILESSKWQTSIGKKIMGLILTDAEGNRLSFWTCFARAFVFQIIFWIEILASGVYQKEFFHDKIFHHTKVIYKR
ncbi:MAG: RDD family protein [Alphaproteobacteria bacterium]|nr:RDD family protein [Alphaproteobacteria bacterium]